MSKVNIKRAVENIRANTTVYTSIVEVVVNAIQAIESRGGQDGKIEIKVLRSEQLEMDGSLSDVRSFEIVDNGIGFTDENRWSFDTLYTDLRIEDGGKGFGRFTCLKYFDDLHVESVYQDNGIYKHRAFDMGKDTDIIINEKISDSSDKASRTIIHLKNLKKGRSIDKRLNTIARNIVEKLLPYFITQDYICPEVILSEEDRSGSIRLNDFFNNELSSVIEEVPVSESTFTLQSSNNDETIEEFIVRVFKLYYPRNQRSRISLVAHKREVTASQEDRSGSIRLNDFFNNELSSVIEEVPVSESTFTLQSSNNDETIEEFIVRVFKLYYPRNQRSRISLVAHKREVSGSVIDKYIPEFSEDFYDNNGNGEVNRDRNYIVKAYVFSSYLDNNVSLERGSFEFQMDRDLQFGISQIEIEARSAEIAKNAVGSDVAIRQEKKRVSVQAYVEEEAPWHKDILEAIDLAKMPYNPSNEEIESRLHQEKFRQETQLKKDVTQLLNKEGNLEARQKDVAEIVSKISGNSKNDLIHYIALRRNILDIFGKSLQVDESGEYSSEGIVHEGALGDCYAFW